MNGKKILSLLLSVVCAFGAAACREQEEPPQKTPYELYAEVPVVYEKRTAAYEDSALSLWFDHAFSKTVRQDVTPTGRDTYKIYMGKNEKENCQFFLSGAEDKTFSVSATDFRSETGDKVPVSLYYQYYFEMDYEGERQDVPDAIPPVKEGAVFTVRAEESAGFVLQAKTSPDTPSGDYTAELTVLNEAGQEVKTATVFLHVWDFTLSEDTVCRTAMWVDKNRLGGHDYQTLYDYLLENRVNAYDLPYALSDPAVDEYLDNPRVNSFNILGFKFNRESGKSEGQIRDAMTYAYEKLSPVAAWKEKGYFYLVDEPNVNESHKLNWIAEYGQWLEECFPGYRQLSPFFSSLWLRQGETDWIEYLRPYIRIWVPKTIAYTTLEEYGSIRGAEMLYQGDIGGITAKFGDYPDRVKKMEQEDGAEAWWYVTSQPSDPYITLNTTEPGVAYRVLFWQQKLYGVKGFLYWSTNYWSGDGWNACENVWGDRTTYGNGQLMYPGGKVGEDTPVGSLRLESVRDGIEDYQVFTMLEERIGAEETANLIRRTTTHPAVWNADEDDFAGERIILGNWLEALSQAR